MRLVKSDDGSQLFVYPKNPAVVPITLDGLVRFLSAHGVRMLAGEVEGDPERLLTVGPLTPREQRLVMDYVRQVELDHQAAR